MPSGRLWLILALATFHYCAAATKESRGFYLKKYRQKHSSTANHSWDRQKHSSSNHSWDHLTFTQQWPQTTCLQYAHRHHCAIPSGVESWTVHGLWPTLKHTRGPHNCNASWPFDEAQIVDLKDEMKKFWPNLFTDTPMTDLWQHEWTKHGTCAASLPSLRGEHNYFQASLHLREKYAFKDILHKKGIDPHHSKGYQLKDILAALGNALRNKTISVQCLSLRDKMSSANVANEVFSTKRQYFSQVEVCLDKQFEPIDCPDAGTCSRHQPIFYPPIIHRKIIKSLSLSSSSTLSSSSPSSLSSSPSLLARIINGNSPPLIL